MAPNEPDPTVVTTAALSVAVVIAGASGLLVLEPFPGRHSVATFASFVVAGCVPLLSYVVIEAADPFGTAILLTLVTLFVVGASRSLVTGQRWWWSGLEMLVVGSAAAAVAYGVGAFVERLT